MSLFHEALGPRASPFPTGRLVWVVSAMSSAWRVGHLGRPLKARKMGVDHLWADHGPQLCWDSSSSQAGTWAYLLSHREAPPLGGAPGFNFVR